MPSGVCLRLCSNVVCVRVRMVRTFCFFFIFIFIFYMWLCVGCRLVLFACVCLLELACVHGWANERMVAFAFVCVCGCLASACGLCLLVCSFLLVFGCVRVCSPVDKR